MVFNTFIKCQVCGSITRVRLQVGWQEEHPIVVACGKCGTSLSGSVKIGQNRPGLKFSFDNADEIPDAEADYMVECSGEFPTVKQGKAAELEEVVITPFIRYMNRMKTDDSYEQFRKMRYHSLMQQKRNGRAIKESLTSSEIIVNTLFRRYKRNSPDNTFSAEMSLRY